MQTMSQEIAVRAGNMLAASLPVGSREHATVLAMLRALAEEQTRREAVEAELTRVQRLAA